MKKIMSRLAFCSSPVPGPTTPITSRLSLVLGGEKYYPST